MKRKVVGIYGIGNMGKSFAKKLLGMDCEVIGYDIKSNVECENLTQVSLDEFMNRTEILSIHIPLKEDTFQLFDRAYFKKFPKLKILINTSRGEILNTRDLVELLEVGELYGAGLDVLENEKLSTYSEEDEKLLERLTSNPNVIVTPHIGGWTFESYERINEVLVKKLRAQFI